MQRQQWWGWSLAMAMVVVIWTGCGSEKPSTSQLQSGEPLEYELDFPDHPDDLWISGYQGALRWSEFKAIFKRALGEAIADQGYIPSEFPQQFKVVLEQTAWDGCYEWYYNDIDCRWDWSMRFRLRLEEYGSTLVGPSARINLRDVDPSVLRARARYVAQTLLADVVDSGAIATPWY